MKNEKKKNIIILLLVVIILVLLVIMGLLLKNQINLSSNQASEENLESLEEQLGIKIDDDLDYVYDANYSYNNEYTEFYRASYNHENVTRKISNFGIEVEYTDGMQYLSNLKVPYININTSDAASANQELETLYLENAKTFDTCAKDQEISCSQILTYRTYTYRDVLSVVVIDSIQGTSKWVLNYHIYNFDLTTGNILKYNDLLSKLGYDKEGTLSKMESLLKNKMDELYESINVDLSRACREGVSNNGDYNEISCYDKANELLENSIQDDSVLVFVNNEGNLNVLAVAYYDTVQDGTVNKYLLEVTK